MQNQYGVDSESIEFQPIRFCLPDENNHITPWRPARSADSNIPLNIVRKELLRHQDIRPAGHEVSYPLNILRITVRKAMNA